MKQCDYCGTQNVDAANVCRGCGFYDVWAKPDPVIARRQKEASEAPGFVVAAENGFILNLKCRTPGEAYLVAEYLEHEGIIALLPTAQDLLVEWKKSGYVEVTVSAQAYKSATELRAMVEDRHAAVIADRPLGIVWKFLALSLGVVLFPLFMIICLDYQGRGYKRMSQELALWVLLGMVSLAVVIYCFHLFA